jgi:hypothetical protein
MNYKGEIEMAKNKVKVMGPKINATKEIDITDFKLNGRFDVMYKREVVFDKKFHTVYTLTDKDEIVVREKELLNIISTSKYFELDRYRFPYRARPIINVLIPDIFNHNNGEPIHCNACVSSLEIYEASSDSKYLYLRFKLTILDYTNTELENDIDTIQLIEEPSFWANGVLRK